MGTYINIGNAGFQSARNGENVDKSGLIAVMTGHRTVGHLCLIGTISMGHSDNPNDSLGLFLIGYRDYPNDSLRPFERSKGIIRISGASRAG